MLRYQLIRDSEFFAAILNVSDYLYRPSDVLVSVATSEEILEYYHNFAVLPTAFDYREHCCRVIRFRPLGEPSYAIRNFIDRNAGIDCSRINTDVLHLFPFGVGPKRRTSL
jgi:hypothetical protein